MIGRFILRDQYKLDLKLILATVTKATTERAETNRQREIQSYISNLSISIYKNLFIFKLVYMADLFEFVEEEYQPNPQTVDFSESFWNF